MKSIKKCTYHPKKVLRAGLNSFPLLAAPPPLSVSDLHAQATKSLLSDSTVAISRILYTWNHAVCSIYSI